MHEISPTFLWFVDGNWMMNHSINLVELDTSMVTFGIHLKTLGVLSQGVGSGNLSGLCCIPSIHVH